MTAQKHTPEPWAADISDPTDCVIFAGDEFVANIGHRVQPVTVAFDVDIANARLIAAAPDMLALVKLVHGSFGGGRVVTFSDDDIAQFEAAIAKAEGRS